MAEATQKKIRLTAINQDAGEFAWKTLILLGGCYAMWATAVVCYSTGVLPLWCAFLLVLAAMYAMFTPMHEASHHNIGGRNQKLRWVDTLAGNLAAAALVVPYVGFERLHYSHHQNTNIVGKDPDLWVNGSNSLMIILRCLTIFPKQMYFFLSQPIATRKQKAQGVIIYLSILAIAIVGCLSGFWVEVVVLWLLPAWLGLGILAYCFDYLPHVPFIETKVFKNTRNVGMPRLNYIFLYQNYHQIHHLNPRIPFYKYYRSFKRIEPLLAEKNSA